MLSTLAKNAVVTSRAGTSSHDDPLRVPRWSFPVSFLPLAAFIVAMALLSTPAQAANCVCNYSPDVDYFDTKLAPQYATGYNISYHKSYKVITTHAVHHHAAQTYVAYLCGTPIPNGVTGTPIQIPIKTVGLTSTTYLPYVDYLGQRESLYFVNEYPSTMSSCVHKLYEEGQIQYSESDSGTATYYNSFDYYDLSQSSASSIAAKAGNLSAFFYGGFDDPNTPTVVGNLFYNQTVSILMGETSEASSLGVFEWLYFIAAFYNLDATAQVVADNVFSRYTCNANLVKNAPESGPNILWGSFYNGVWEGHSCEWQCGLVHSANATFLTPSLTYPASIDDFVNDPTVQSADVWIYDDFNWNMTSPYGNAAIFSGANVAKLQTLKAVQNKKVFDFLGEFYEELFDNVKAEPDVVLLDLIQVGFNDSFIPNRNRYFLRNVFNEPGVSTAEQSGSDCPDASAPLITGWLTGPCSNSGPAVTISYAGVDLCPPTGRPTNAPSKAPTITHKYALDITLSSGRRVLSLNSTTLAAITTYLQNVLTSQTGATVHVDSLSQIGNTTHYLVIYHFVASPSATPITTAQAQTISTFIESDPNNTFGISALAVGTTGSPSASPTHKPTPANDGAQSVVFQGAAMLLGSLWWTVFRG